MHITCEHCGSTIDLDKDKVCPSCGAPYNNNKEYKYVKEYHKKHTEMDLHEREINIKNKELAGKAVKTVFAGQAIGFAIFAIIFITIFISIGVSFFGRDEGYKSIETEILDNDEEEEEVEPVKEISVSFNELAQTDTFEIKCDAVSNYKLNDYETRNLKNTGLVVYNFQVLFTNKTDRWVYLKNLKLTYTDSNGNENISAKEHDSFFNNPEHSKRIDESIHDRLTHKGNMSYELPKDVKDVKLVYENVTININNFKSLIK